MAVRYAGEMHGEGWSIARQFIEAPAGLANPDSVYRSCDACGRFSGVARFCEEHSPLNRRARRASLLRSIPRVSA